MASPRAESVDCDHHGTSRSPPASEHSTRSGSVSSQRSTWAERRHLYVDRADRRSRRPSLPLPSPIQDESTWRTSPRGLSPREPLSPSRRLFASAYQLRAVADGDPDPDPDLNVNAGMVDLMSNNNNNNNSNNKYKFGRMKSGHKSANGKNDMNQQRDAEAQVVHDDLLHANVLGPAYSPAVYCKVENPTNKHVEEEAAKKGEHRSGTTSAPPRPGTPAMLMNMVPAATSAAPPPPIRTPFGHETRRSSRASVHPAPPGNAFCSTKEAFGPYLTVSDHLGYESSILPGTPLPGIAEEKKTYTDANSSSAAAATAAASAAAAAATTATAPAFAYGSIDSANLSGSSIEKDAAGLPFFDEQMQFADSNTLLFRDGRRRIDMVLVWEEEPSGVPTEAEVMRAERRARFHAAIEAEGLQLELESREVSFDGKTYFMKIHAPWKVIVRYAEVMNLKMPIKEGEERARGAEHDSRFLPLWRMFELDPRNIPEEPSFYRSTHSNDRDEQFVVKDRETFFTSAQRSQIVWQILMRAKYDDSDKTAAQVGIRRLLSNQTYVTAFPLHEGRYDQDGPNGVIYDRRLLYLEWARAARCYKKQPLWLVRKYFGDKIALYFAWLGFYTKALIAPSIVGFLCFMYGLLSMESDENTPSKEICDLEGVGNITLCPLCDKACRYQKLGESCVFARLTYLFDNPATVFFAIFMSFWATTFLELWKRHQAVISWEWDLTDIDQEEEPRPEFETSVNTFRVNPVTREREPYMPSWSRCLRFMATGSMVLFMVVVVCCAVLGTIIYRISLVMVFHDSGNKIFLRKHAKILTSITAAVINLVIIMILTRFYHKLALWLTNLENPRTQSEYEDNFTFKIFVFEFMNFYSSLIYIAFFKGRFFVHPGDETARSSEFLRLKGDVCDPAGCLSELCIQLAIIMVGKQFLNNILEVFYPKFWNWWYRRVHRSHTKQNLGRGFTRWEDDYQLQDPGRLALFDEYLEMVLQYGFVTLFVAAFPLAPLFALINNIAEIRLDAYKMVTQARRPLAERVEDIGAWHGILQTITYISVVSNAFVIAYTSDFIPRMVYKFKYSGHDNLVGYIDSSLSVFNTSDYREDMGSDDDDPDPDTCQYRGYRNGPDHPTDPYGLSPQYWHVFAARLAFVVVFEHIVFALTGIMAYVIPDVPNEVRTQIQREKLLAKEAKFEHGLQKDRSEDEYDELLAALRERNNSRFGDILRRGSWGRRMSRQSDALDAHVDVGSRHRALNSSTVWEVP